MYDSDLFCFWWGVCGFGLFHKALSHSSLLLKYLEIEGKLVICIPSHHSSNHIFNRLLGREERGVTFTTTYSIYLLCWGCDMMFA